MNAEAGPTTATDLPAAEGTPLAAPSRTILCPGCGYDLRAATGDRCSECGLVIDREALGRSGFPWAHRRGIGRVRAYFKTVWLVTVDSKQLAQETAKTQSPRDAAAFLWWVGLAMTACFVAAVVMLVESGAIAEAAVDPQTNFRMVTRWPGLVQDLVVPWSAGIARREWLFFCAALLGFYVAGAPRAVIRTGAPSSDFADTVRAIGAYAAAPLTFVAFGAAGYSLVAVLETYVGVASVVRNWLPAGILIILSFLLIVLGVAFTVYRTGQWRARTAHAGYPTGFGGMGELLLRWAVGAFVVIGIVPWCVGLLWIALDSFL